MRRESAVALVVVFLGVGSALAVDEVGCPVTTLAPGQVAVALESGRSWRDLDIKMVVNGERVAFHGRPLRRSPLTLRLDMGVLEGVEVFSRVGMSHSEAVNAVSLIGEDADGDKEFTAGGGVRATLWDFGDGIRVGALAQVNYHHLDDNALEFSLLYYNLDVDFWEFTTAVGVDAERGPVSLYGGLMASLFKTDASLQASRGDTPLPADINLDPTGNLGLFAGVDYAITPRISLSLSGHWLEGDVGLGGALAIKL